MHPARHWTEEDDGRLKCTLCPRFCTLREGQRGLCFVRMREGFLQYLPIGGLIGIILLIELGLVFGTWILAPEMAQMSALPTPAMADVSNTEAIGRVMYTKYVYLFQASGLVLLVAMIGAIVLTMRQREGVRKQSIAVQNARRPEDVVATVKVPTGGGV